MPTTHANPVTPVVETSFESLNSYDEILKAAKAAGIKDSKLTEGIGQNYLPKVGTFESVKIMNPNTEYAYIQMMTSGNGHISMGALSATFADKANATLDDVIFSDNTKSYYLPTVSHRPAFTGNQAAIAASLIGQSFKAEPITGFISKFSKEGYDTPEKVAISTKNFYLVDLTK